MRLYNGYFSEGEPLGGISVLKLVFEMMDFVFQLAGGQGDELWRVDVSDLAAVEVEAAPVSLFINVGQVTVDGFEGVVLLFKAFQLWVVAVASRFSREDFSRK